MEQNNGWSAEEEKQIRLQLQRVLSSTSFCSTERLQRLLTYLVDESLAGRSDKLNQARIAIDGLGKDVQFDAATDSTVRVEAKRLRSRLIEYYYGDGQHDLIRFELPKGHYSMRIYQNAEAVQADTGSSLDSAPCASSVDEELLPPREYSQKLRSPWPRVALIGAATIAALVVILVVYLAWRDAPVNREDLSLEQGSGQIDNNINPPDTHSIAVLLFDTWGDHKPEERHLSLGLTDDILTNLSRISNLRVISRSSSMRFNPADASISEIGRQLSVANVLEGSIRFSGNRIKVTAQLIRVADDAHLWANDYVREIEPGGIAYFEVTGEIARAIAHNLNVTILKDENQRIGIAVTDYPEAYDLFTRARFLMTDDRTADEIQRAIDYLQRAIELDPGFAHAHAELADAYEWLLQVDNRQNDPGAWQGMRSHYETAMQLDPTLAKPYVIQGLSQIFSLDFSAARQSLEKAIALDNSLPTAHSYYSMLLAMLGEYEKAIYHGKLATDLDPLDAQSWVGGLAFRYLSAVDPQNAIAACRHALTLNEDYWGALWVMGMAFNQLGQDADAIEVYERAHQVSGGIDDVNATLAFTYGRQRQTDKARAIIQQFEQDGVSPVLQAVAWVGLGDNNHALALLEEAAAKADEKLWYVPGGLFFYFKPLQREPRYKAIWVKMNLEDGWDKMLALLEGAETSH